MKKTAVFLALTSLFASTTSWAEPFRLAFSKAEQIEIFVDRAPDGSWCSPSLNMRAVYGGEPDHAALVRLMPKVGALLDAHCAEATLVTWEARDKNGAQLAYGNSAKSEGWQLVHAPERTASASAGAKGHVAALQGAVANQDTQQTAALDMRTEKVATGAEEREALEVARADDRQAERIAREEQRASARKQANAEREAKRLALAEERRARQAALEAERAAARLAAEQAKAKKIAAQKAAAEQAEAENLQLNEQH